MDFRPARRTDEPAIMLLLNTSGLPTLDIDVRTCPFILAWEADRIVGVIGLEIHGPDGLLRSVAVAQQRRGQGLGRDLCLEMMQYAADHGVETLHLLTETAEDLFRRLEFEVVDRDAIPPRIRATEEFTHLCPASATAMSLRIRPEAAPVSEDPPSEPGVDAAPSRGEVLEFHRVFSELVRKYQFRDRNELTCGGLTVSQCHALEVIGDGEDLRIGEVASRLHLSISTVSRLVDHLVDAGLVQRVQDPDSRRAWNVSLSPPGVRVHEEIMAGVLLREGEALSGLTPDGRRALVDGLAAISTAVNNWRVGGPAEGRGAGPIGF